MPEFAIQTPARKIFSSGIFMKSFQPSNRVYSCCLNATKTSSSSHTPKVTVLFRVVIEEIVAYFLLIEVGNDDSLN